MDGLRTGKVGFEQSFEEKGRNSKEETRRRGHGDEVLVVVGSGVFRLEETLLFREMGFMDKRSVRNGQQSGLDLI